MTSLYSTVHYVWMGTGVTVCFSRWKTKSLLHKLSSKSVMTFNGKSRLKSFFLNNHKTCWCNYIFTHSK